MRIFISEAIDAARIQAVQKVLEANCNIVNANFDNSGFCAVIPEITAINCPYHGHNASRCKDCDHMISYNVSNKVVYCMKDKDLQRMADMLDGKLEKKSAKNKPSRGRRKTSTKTNK